MKQAALVFPHQLFKEPAFPTTAETVYLVEEFLFFRQYRFHKQKLVFHRASLQYYANWLRHKNFTVEYIESGNPLSDIRQLIPHLAQTGVSVLHYYDTTDNWLEKRIASGVRKAGIQVAQYGSPQFLNSREMNAQLLQGKERFFQTDFYIQQRKRLQILTDAQGKPLGGKWSFDAENRLKYPKGQQPPPVSFPAISQHYREAIVYVEKYFAGNVGQINESFVYPTTHAEAENWLQLFLAQRLAGFGAYEDAMLTHQAVLHHSLLTPLLNTGLLTPAQVVNAAIGYANASNIPLNSLEGFVRQVIGWREFVRAVYETAGTRERTHNYWKFSREIPASFYTGTTGIEPVDTVIKRVFRTGYCHHIERLMVLGNFMLLCAFDPDEVYRWFMELFIDAYDWVMVPNVYGMSQFADGGMMCTKPYISGSNYLLKMSDFKKGNWQPVWDGLFWRFMHTHRNFFLQNPRLGMLVNTFDKMDAAKQQQHLKTAGDFLNRL